jgi:16S rRNA (guanine527-N7)-methyltransferase
MSFEQELEGLLPPDLPHRERVVKLGAWHLDLIVEANQVLNLTRIVGERDAAIKHVLDSVLPWRHFAGARLVVDAGTGAGLPGIPLALVLPETEFVLLESIQKKTRFVESAIEKLGLPNVTALPLRVEDWLKENQADLITARAMAPLERAIPLLSAGLKAGARAILYKGPDVTKEMDEAANEIRKRRVTVREIDRYDLPDNSGTRTLIEVVQGKQDA